MNKIIASCFVCVLYVILYSCCSHKSQKNSGALAQVDTSSNESISSHLLPLTSKNHSYSRFEIYCWCFNSVQALKDSTGLIYLPVTVCTTPNRVDQSDLIRPIRLYSTISDSLKIQSLKKLFFNNISESKIITSAADARFVILFRKNDFFCDTLLYSNNAEFIYNGVHLYKYSFNVMDSLKRILGLEKIACRS